MSNDIVSPSPAKEARAERDRQAEEVFTKYKCEPHPNSPLGKLMTVAKARKANPDGTRQMRPDIKALMDFDPALFVERLLEAAKQAKA